VSGLPRRTGVPVVTRGGWNGAERGSVPVAGRFVICLVDMAAILEVDAKNLTLRAQSVAAVTQKIDEAAGKHGLFYPPDTASMKISTIGVMRLRIAGRVAGIKIRSGGGSSRDGGGGCVAGWARGGISVVGCVKDVAGDAMKDLFIGSEGNARDCHGSAFKVASETSGTAKNQMLALFNKMEDAAETVSSNYCGADYSLHVGVFGPDDDRFGALKIMRRVGLPPIARRCCLMEYGRASGGGCRGSGANGRRLAKKRGGSRGENGRRCG